MKSIRLNESIRNSILNSILGKWKENNPTPELSKAEHTLIYKFWKKKYGKYQEHFDAIPIDVFKTKQAFLLQINGQIEKFGLNKPLPSVDSGYRGEVLGIIEDTNTEYKKFKKVKDAHEKWFHEHNELKVEAETILASVNTTKQLLEVWPEVEPFLPPHVADPSKAVNLPAIPVSRLNERIGLNKKP